MAVALQRLGNDASIYAWVLLTFCEEQRKNLPLLAPMLNDEDQRKLAARSIHTLKGQAATIGAHALSERAQTLETMLLNGAPLDDCRTLFEHIRNRLVPLLDAITAAHDALTACMAKGNAPPPGNR